MQVTPTQSKILAALIDGESSRTDLRQSSLVYGSTFTHALAKMITLGLVDDEREYGSKKHIVSITHEGKRCLKLFERGVVEEGPKVAPRTFHRKDVYQPGTIYSRNNGNTHIPSVGVRC